MVNLPAYMEICFCLKCDRKISVKRAVNGNDHTVVTEVMCWDCLSQEDKKKIIKNFDLDEKYLDG